MLKISEADAKGFGISPPPTSCRVITDKDTLTSVGWPADSKSDHDTVAGKITGNLGPFGAFPTTLPLIHGMSGGPVYDEQGTVVGVNLGALKNDPTRTFILPYAYARAVLFQSTAPACDQASTKPPLRLTLSMRVAKEKIIRVRRLQDPGQTTHVYSEEYEADAGFRIVESTFSSSHCNWCIPMHPMILDGGLRGSFSYTLNGGAGFIDGAIGLKEIKDLTQSFDLPTPVKGSWNGNIQLPSDDLTVQSIEIRDNNGQTMGEVVLPGTIPLPDRKLMLNLSQQNHSLRLSVDPHE